MKKSLLLLMSLIIYGTLSAQTKNQNKTSQLYEINPVGNDQLDWHLKFGGEFKFKITHVNAIKLSGYTTSKPFTFEADAPSVFSSVTIPKAADDAVKTAKAGKSDMLVQLNNKRNKTDKSNKTFTALMAKKMKAIAQTLDSIQNLTNTFVIDDFKNNYNYFITNYRKLQQYVVVEDTLYKMLPDVIVPSPGVLKGNTKEYMLAVYSTNDTTAFPAILKTTLNELNTLYISLKSDYQTLNKTIDSANSTVSGQLKNKDGSVILNIANSKVVIKMKARFEDEFNAATKIFNDINKDDNQTKLFNKAFKGIELYNLIANNCFTVYTDAQQLTDDEVQVTPLLKNSAGKTIKEFNPVTIRAYGSIKVNFSTGYLLTFKGDDNYSYYSDGTPAAIKGVTKQNKNDLTNAIGALAHVYYRTPEGLSGGLSGGFSLTNNGSVGFYLGASGLFLEKNRLALTAGISYIKVNTLNTGNLNAVDQNKYTFNSTDTKINYDQLYKRGFFIGITYNIFTNSAAKTTTATH